MAEISADLVYEVLKSIQARQAKMDEKLNELNHGVQAVRISMNAVRQETVGVHTELSGIHGTLVRHELQLDRIEHRLELSNAPTLSA